MNTPIYPVIDLDKWNVVLLTIREIAAVGITHRKQEFPRALLQ